MLIDGFMFNNELDMLEYRLTILDDVVDYFVLVEAGKTHIGDLKQLYYNENKGRYAKWEHKIIHIIADLYTKTPWHNENMHRRAIDRGIQKLNPKSDDLIIISDLDEIPNPNILIQLKSKGIDKMVMLEMEFYNFNIETIVKVPKFQEWKSARILPYSIYESKFRYDCQDIRGCGFPIPPDTLLCKNAGWHLSWFLPPELCVKKIKSFAHTEFNTDDKTSDFFKDIIESKKTWINKDQELLHIPVQENKNLPPRVDLLLKWFPPPAKSE